MWYFRVGPQHGVGKKERTWFNLNVDGVHRGQEDIRYLLVEGL